VPSRIWPTWAVRRIWSLAVEIFAAEREHLAKPAAVSARNIGLGSFWEI
jgi:hypothetical protein